MAAITAAAGILSQIPKWVWILAASLYGTKQAADLTLGLRGYGVQKQQVRAGLRGQKYQAAIGKREERRTNELITQLLTHTTKQKAESQEFDVLRMLMSGGQQQKMLMMTLMQAAGQKPAPSVWGPPPTSLMSLMR